jgi:preprotein translocase subunit YajC
VNGGQVIFLVLPVALILLLVNSQRKRSRQSATLQSALTVGAEVCTTSGLFGTVVSLTDREVLLEAAPGVKLRFDRRAVALVVPSEVPDVPPDDLETGPDGHPEHP